MKLNTVTVRKETQPQRIHRELQLEIVKRIGDLTTAGYMSSVYTFEDLRELHPNYYFPAIRGLIKAGKVIKIMGGAHLQYKLPHNETL